MLSRDQSNQDQARRVSIGELLDITTTWITIYHPDDSPMISANRLVRTHTLDGVGRDD